MVRRWQGWAWGSEILDHWLGPYKVRNLEKQGLCFSCFCPPGFLFHSSALFGMWCLKPSQILSGSGWVAVGHRCLKVGIISGTPAWGARAFRPHLALPAHFWEAMMCVHVWVYEYTEVWVAEYTCKSCARKYLWERVCISMCLRECVSTQVCESVCESGVKMGVPSGIWVC